MSNFEKEWLLRGIENELNKIFLSPQVLEKSFKSDLSDVKKKTDLAVKNLVGLDMLIEKYQTRANLTSRDIEKITGIGDFSSFKKNKEFTKSVVCILTICLQLKYDEAIEFLLAASIELYPQESVYDCVYTYYMKNYTKKNNPKENIDEFKYLFKFSNEYVKRKMFNRED